MKVKREQILEGGVMTEDTLVIGYGTRARITKENSPAVCEWLRDNLADRLARKGVKAYIRVSKGEENYSYFTFEVNAVRDYEPVRFSDEEVEKIQKAAEDLVNTFYRLYDTYELFTRFGMATWSEMERRKDSLQKGGER